MCHRFFHLLKAGNQNQYTNQSERYQRLVNRLEVKNATMDKEDSVGQDDNIIETNTEQDLEDDDDKAVEMEDSVMIL